jgi:predicted transcriptional regulator
MKLRRRGIDLFEEESLNILKSLRVHDIVDQEPEILQASDNFQTVVERVLTSEHTEFFVVNRRGDLLGSIHLRELTRMLAEQDVLKTIIVAEDLLEPNEPTVTSDDDLDLVMQLFGGSLHDEVGVVAWDNPRKLVGSVHKKDVLHAYNREVMRRDMAGSVSSTVIVASKGQQVGLGGGFVLQEIQPPPRYFGRTIRELDIAAETGVHIILLRKRAPADGGPPVRVPTANDRIDEGDRLVVAGTKNAVEAMDVI